MLVTEEGDEMWNSRLNCLLISSYNYINDIQVKNFDTLPCFESFANAFAHALQMSQSLLLRRMMRCGMAGLISSLNSATTTSMMFRSKKLILYLALRVLPMHLHMPYKH